jgi:UDP-N-acetylglucosamine acyltransferase
MIAGGVRVNRDCPPFFLYGGLYAEPKGLNVVGLRRAGFTAEQISSLKKAYRLLYRSGLKLEEALARIEAEVATEEARHLVAFIRRSERGIARPRARRDDAE